jgi:hypothetical protein
MLLVSAAHQNRVRCPLAVRKHRNQRSLELLVAVSEGDQGKVTSALDGFCQLSLVPGFGACDTARDNLASLGDVLLEHFDILVINLGYAFSSKPAKFSSSVKS